MIALEQALQKYFGHNSFRTPQKEIIEKILEGKDTFALLPTGGGKSLCYQLPAVMSEGLTLVISPLISLMNDQVSQLKFKKISAVSIHSALKYKEIDVILDNAIFGKYKLLYLSPERIQTPLFVERVSRMNIDRLVIDEAHCISDWGYDFRPAYLQIKDLKELLPKVPTLVLTATATQTVVNDIQSKLDISPKVFQKSFHRENLEYLVIKESDKNGRLLNLIKRIEGSGIIYAPTRRTCKEIHEFLKAHNVDSNFYHAGLNHKEREEAQLNWQKSTNQVMVATNAFGMGIDKPDVRFVVHLHIPNSLEAYYQEAGRAGRDGEKAFAVIFFTQHDIDLVQNQLENTYPEKDEVKRVYKAIGNFLQLADESGQNQGFPFELKKFCNTFKFNPVRVLNALKILEYEGYISLSEQLYYPSKIQFLVQSNELYNFIVAHPNSGKVLNTLLRSYGGAFDQMVRINEFDIARRVGFQVEDVKRYISHFQEIGLVDYQAQNDLPMLTFMKEKVTDQNFKLSANNYHFLKNRAIERLNSVLAYIEQDQCRVVTLLSYFGETIVPCGTCDYCRKKASRKNQLNSTEKGILAALPSNGDYIALSHIFQSIQCSEDEFREAQLRLIDKGIIEVSGDQMKRLKA